MVDGMEMFVCGKIDEPELHDVTTDIAALRSRRIDTQRRNNSGYGARIG